RKIIEPLSRRFRVVVPDLRGYNETDKPRGVKNYDIDVLSEDIRQLIKGLGEEKATIVGHDWGGAILWNIMLRTPEVLDRAVVINLPHPAIFSKAIGRSFRQTMRSWYFFCFQIPLLPELLLRLFLRPAFWNIFRNWPYQKDAYTHEEVAQLRANFKKPGVMRSAINYYRAAFRYRKRHLHGLKKPIAVPTHMIWGENDKALGKELTIGTEKYFSGYFKLDYIPKCSHWVMSEYPERVTEIMIEFLHKHLEGETHART
ncbi:MAG: alpha/beta hydrolase, partial [Bacteroidota bacterium]